MAGGTIVMNLINEGLPVPEVVIGLKRAGLATEESDNGSRVIGAMTTLSTLTGDSDPLISQAARACGGWAIRNMATIGGNLFAPTPSGDLSVALLALDSSLRISSQDETRVLSLADFYASGRVTGDHELVTAIAIPDVRRTTRFVKYGRKAGPTPSVVTVAVSLAWEGATIETARIAVGAMAPHPTRAERAEGLLVGNRLSSDLIDEVGAVVGSDLAGTTDAVASAWYRKKMAALHVRRLLQDIERGDGER